METVEAKTIVMPVEVERMWDEWRNANYTAGQTIEEVEPSEIFMGGFLSGVQAAQQQTEWIAVEAPPGREKLWEGECFVSFNGIDDSQNAWGVVAVSKKELGSALCKDVHVVIYAPTPPKAVIEENPL